MSTNDLIILDKIMEDVQKTSFKTYSTGKFFEIFCAEQILKNYDLSLEEIESGITDGCNDGGIDGFYIFVNGNLLSDLEDINFYKKEVSMEVVLLTSKHDDSFEQSVINCEYSTIHEILDFSKDNESLIGTYNDAVLEHRSIFINAYMKFATKLRNFSIRLLYVSRGDSNLVAENVEEKSQLLVDMVKKYFSNCKVEYNFIGALELLEFYRKQREFNLNLPFCEQLSADNQKYIILCNLNDYYNFLKDEKGELKRYLFDSNVRDYNGLNKTNSDILSTLCSETSEDFWWLNNGITILSSHAINMGKVIQIDNVQIVNGLQTSFTIFEYFKNNPDKIDSRKLMVKIITETDNEVRDKIIRATNRQTSINESSLHATDKIQRNIEDILLKNGMYYERRTNFYVNQGICEELIFSPLYLGAAFEALINKDLIKAFSLKQKFMQDREKYENVYLKTPLEFWPKLAKIQRNTDNSVIKNKKSKGLNPSEGYLKVFRHIVSFLTLSNYFKKYDYNHKDFDKLTMDEIDKFEYESILNKLLVFSPKFDKKIWRKRDFINKVIEYFSVEFNIKNPESIVKRRYGKTTNFKPRKIEYDKELFEKVKREIPKQPWNKGMSRDLSEKLKLPHKVVTGIIKYYIRKGYYYYQTDGRLFDKNGNEIKL